MRLRAAVFCNLVDMREAISIDKYGNRHATLSDANVQKLQQANFLFHAALNGLIPRCYTYVHACRVILHLSIALAILPYP